MKSLLFSLPIAVAAVMAPMLAQADVSFVVSIAPPALPVYVQPPIPGYGYIWTPGYWSWSDDYDEYYWVPGTWVTAPYVGALWTPGYWTADGDRYGWHDGYWGTRIGFYGGVNYGFGYVGVGYQGGYWDRGEFRYNRAVNNITTTNIANVYNTTVVNHFDGNRASYNGGAGGVHLQPSRSELDVIRLPHVGPTSMQVQHQQAAIANPMQLASFNHGLPRVAATPAPGAFNAPNAVSGYAAHSQPAPRVYGGAAQYQQDAQVQPPALRSQFQQQPVQSVRPPERYVPQADMRQQAAWHAQPMAVPAQHEVARQQPIASPPQNVRPAPQEYRYQQAIVRSSPVEHPVPAETVHAQAAIAMQPHQNAPHEGHSKDREYRER